MHKIDSNDINCDIVLDEQKARWAPTDAHSEDYTQSPLACTKRCLHTIKSQSLRDTGR